jgi:predicted DNA-binding antitoxin AbrB/MazE fold protein
MVQHTEAVYEGGVLRPLSPLTLAEHARVFLQVIDENAVSTAEVSLAEFDRALDELATDGPVVAGSFSRANIYADHE